MELNDNKTANAFSNSWNNLPRKSIYTRNQFEEWLAPVNGKDVKNKTVLELGCGNASLMYYMAEWSPDFLVGVDLGDSVKSANDIMRSTKYKKWEIIKKDLIFYQSEGYDFVYCIGVLHHLKKPIDGFSSVVRNTKSGGFFHCWVYAREGNSVIVYIVDPIRKISAKFPWWFTKYFVALPLVIPFFLYAKLLKKFQYCKLLNYFPLFEYSLWIANRNFHFFHHVAFDQLVTPQTCYMKKNTIRKWLTENLEIDQDSIYIIMRNGNSWKFGGKKLKKD
ncbi:MAG: class I SAM-dependent methyltransferase [Patescibacteria group bacterium]|nr:class I SAM-dependent methyltransferase [Patescibacteria group bacterium]